jgi:3-isopropylmalate/(R)-2-methylmalate dehydratase small subunit
MEPFRRIRSRTVVIASQNIDTDQIIPARFLTTTTRAGLARGLFADWRYDASGAPRPEFVLNRPESAGCAVLVAGPNIGCGSSREHAPWALLDHGFRVVVSTEIADIFRANALKNGLLPVTIDAASHAFLVANPGVEVDVDLESKILALPGGRRVAFPVEAFARYCLLNGIDELDYLLGQERDIAAFEARHRA